MKNLVLGSLFAVVASQAAGCIISTSGDEEAAITVNWSLQNVSGTTTSCPPGTTTAAIYSQPVDASYRPIGAPFIDLYDCEDRTGVAFVPPDLYQVWVELESETGATEYARSLSAIVDVFDTDKTFTTTILNDGGYFQLAWELFDGPTGTPLECSDVAGLDGIGVISTSVANEQSFFDDQYDCEDHYGVTGGLLAGSYTVKVDAFNDAAGPLGMAPRLDNQIIGRQNQVTSLGTINIPID